MRTRASWPAKHTAQTLLESHMCWSQRIHSDRHVWLHTHVTKSNLNENTHVHTVHVQEVG